MERSALTPTMTEPADVAIDSPTSPLVITWEDGHVSSFPLAHLRQFCPCATCTGHGAIPLEERLAREIPPLGTELKALYPVGNYAVQLVFGDGHSGGIFSYSLLRSICPCPTCMPVEVFDV